MDRHGPTADVLQYAMSCPGCIISLKEAQTVYGQKSLGSARSMGNSVSAILRRLFERVEGAPGLHILRSSMINHDIDDDMNEMNAFHNENGCDEFGMSTNRLCPVLPSRTNMNFIRMSDITDEAKKGDMQ